jgi:hypothetical protein
LISVALRLVAFHQAGSRPGGRVTFFASPKKVTKERRPRIRRPAARGPLWCSGLGLHRRTRCAALRSNSCDESVLECASRIAPSPALLGASYGDLKTNTTRLACGIAWRSPLAHCVSQPRTMPKASCACSGPVWGAEERRAGGGVRSTLQQLTHRNCLSGAQRSEFCDAPPDRAPQGTLRAAKGAPSGSPFFGYFLWRRKESDPPAGTGPGLQANNQSTKDKPK